MIFRKKATVFALMLLAAARINVGATIPGPAYSGEDATGPHVLALWAFHPGAEAEDSSGNRHTLSLHGRTRFHPEGKFGSSLAPPTEENASRPSGAHTEPHPSLSPAGAFTIDLWINPDPELAERDRAHLVDKMAIHYIHRDPDEECLRDYMLLLVAAGEGRHQVTAYLGFDREGGMATYTSDPAVFEFGVWTHVAFTYDGEGGGRFYINGRLMGEMTHPDRGPVAPGSRGVTLGDRGAAFYSPFPGRIDQVRLLNRAETFFSGSMELRQATIRRNFLRMESNAIVGLDVLNATEETVQQATLSFWLDDRTSAKQVLPAMAPGERVTVQYPVETTLREGAYTLTAVIEAGEHRDELALPIRMVARDLPRRMPVVSWDHHGDGRWAPFSEVTHLLRDVGFTHRLDRRGGGISEHDVWRKGAPIPTAPVEHLRNVDDALAQGMKITMTPVWTSPPTPKIIGFFDDGRFNRINVAGVPRPYFNACGLFPELQTFAYNMGVSIAQAYHDYPAWDSVLPQSEQRDGTQPCFHEHDREAYRSYSGQEIPPEAAGRYGVRYHTLRGFPATRIIPDTDPILSYYRWFWRDGDGWNELHGRIHDGAKSTGREDIWTWFDPAIRVPARWGSGGRVDVISQWTYTYPNPEVIGLNTDELFAMAAGRPGQDVMKMTQIIWYRDRTAPEPRNDFQAEWEKTFPDPARARWITIPPDHLSLAFWSKISRPIKGIMYHGVSSLLPLDPEDRRSSYVYTHPGTQDVLRDLVRRVVEPLGATLLQVPDAETDVAFLHSFTTEIFTGRGTRGDGAHWRPAETGWVVDSYLALRYAQLQPRIVYEEEVVERGLSGIRVLFMPDCQVLPESVAEKIREFQSAGGIVIGDERLAPGIVADMAMESRSRPERGDQSRNALLETAAWIRENLDPYLARLTDTDNPNVLTRLRRYGSTDYVFAYNDHREFGTYVGHHGRVMESGLPSSATVKVRRAGGYVYDLLETRRVPVRFSGGWLEIPQSFQGGEGRLWMVTRQPIGRVQVRLPERVRRGEPFEILATVLDARGDAMDAVVPVRVDILDARGERMEFSGHYGATDGQARIPYDTAANDAPGIWTVRVTELASGITEMAQFRVE